MKKILVLIMIICSALLISCDKDGLKENKYSFDLDITSKTVLRESIVYDYQLFDEDNLLKNSEVKYSVTKDGSKTAIKSGKLSFADDDKDEVENEKLGQVKITGLEVGTKYVVKFTTGYKGNTVLILKDEVTTSNEGTKDNPYKIKTADDLKNMISNDPKACYILENDIDLKDVVINPLCKSSSSFKGVFDGNGKTIKNYSSGSAPQADKQATYTGLSGQDGGLFGYIAEGGVVKNLTFDNAQIYVSRSSKGHAAIVAGTNCGTIENVTITNSSLNFKGNSNKEYYIGAIAAYNADNGVITDCNVDCDIDIVTETGSIIAGGINAYNEQSKLLDNKNIISNCDYTGTITLTTTKTSTTNIEIALGGIIGRNFASVQACNAVVDFVVKAETKHTGENDPSYRVLIGGLAGHNIADPAVISNSTVTASFDIEAKEAMKVYIGSLLGQNGDDDSNAAATIANCSYTLPAEKTNTISVYKTGEENIFNCDLIGHNNGNADANKTASHSYTVKYFEYQEVDGKDVLEQTGEDSTITVAAIQ